MEESLINESLLTEIKSRVCLFVYDIVLLLSTIEGSIVDIEI